MGNKAYIVVISEVNRKFQAVQKTLVFFDVQEGLDFVKNSGATIISKQYGEVCCSYQF